MTEPMRIAIGADHRGASVAAHLRDVLTAQGHSVTNFGSVEPTEACDYPVPAYQVGRAIGTGETDRGILICGTAIGMSIAANKLPGVRAAVTNDELTAQLSRQHNDANVLCLSGDLLGQRLIDKIVEVWLATAFEGGRHQRRVDKIAMIEQGQDPSSG